MSAAKTGKPSRTILKTPLKLQQNQVYNLGDSYVRIVRLERLEVRYKSLKNLSSRDGRHHTVTKKEFCRLIRTALLVTPEELKKMWVGLANAPAEENGQPPEGLPSEG